MEKLNNPAARLLALLRKARSRIDSKNDSATVWARLLKVPKEDGALLLKRLGGVMELPALIQERVQSYDDVTHSLYLKWVPKVEMAFRATRLNGTFGNFNQHIDDATIYGLEHCADLISKRDAEPEITSDDLNCFRQQIESLIEEVKQAEIETNLRKFILKHLFAIRNAIEEYELFGAAPLITAFGETIASTITDPQQAVKTSKSSQGNKFWKCIAALSVLLAVGDKGLKLTQGVVNLLQDPSGPVIEIPVNPSESSSPES
jgi:hypothetical protein